VSEADCLIAHLKLQPHPEGGHFRETFRDCGHPPAGRDCGHPPGGRDCEHPPAGCDSHPGRAHSTAIYFLLKAGEVSRWHRVDAAEVWHFYKGAPLELRIGEATRILGPDLAKGEMPQAVVPAGVWQAARSLGDYTLVGCTVAPGFEFSGFEMAPEGFAP
jgi:predicted cupin superfamily sugar epimerase